ncbi:hypothetical protein C8F01DRAFT_1091292 [Mycena amicta]|nr:hypothetical protein C8F01DRAFT_1091292 [Mycena amicta]
MTQNDDTSARVKPRRNSRASQSPLFCAKQVPSNVVPELHCLKSAEDVTRVHWEELAHDKPKELIPIPPPPRADSPFQNNCAFPLCCSALPHAIVIAHDNAPSQASQEHECGEHTATGWGKHDRLTSTASSPAARFNTREEVLLPLEAIYEAIGHPKAAPRVGRGDRPTIMIVTIAHVPPPWRCSSDVGLGTVPYSMVVRPYYTATAAVPYLIWPRTSTPYRTGCPRALVRYGSGPEGAINRRKSTAVAVYGIYYLDRKIGVNHLLRDFVVQVSDFTGTFGNLSQSLKNLIRETLFLTLVSQDFGFTRDFGVNDNVQDSARLWCSKTCVVRK